MQSYTPVQNRFWSDGWVRQLNALDRYLFLYLLTNGRAELTGIYELPLDLMASESGIDEKDLRLSMLQRLEPKVYYKEGWVIFRNYPNHRVSNSYTLLTGILNDFNGLPKHIQEIARSIGYPIDTLSIPPRNRIEENRIEKNNTANADSFRIEEEQPKKEKDPANAKYEELCGWAEKRRGFRFVNRLKQYSALKKAKAQDISISKLKERWQELEGESWRDGFDWTSVVSSFDKKS